MAKKNCKHIRRSHPQPVAGKWLMRCDCGWEGRILNIGQTSTKAYEQLNKKFLEHIPTDELQTYVLVDTRVHTEADPETGEPERIYGNFIMPEGVACRLVRDWEDDGVRWAEVQEAAATKPVIALPIGEVRTREGRVFRLD